MSNDHPFSKPLGDGLVLRTAASAQDVERVAAFDGRIHGPGIAPVVRNLFSHYPGASLRDLIFVEDEATGQIVSSLCLIPWTWRCGDAVIPAGEMGIVGTLEAYRQRGLVRAQIAFFKQRLAERGCLVSHIQGIPYYYRQFGYQYALPLEGGLRLTLREVPPPPAATFQFRAATLADMSMLVRLYDDAAQDLAFHAARSADAWRYLLTKTAGGETECDTVLIEDGAGQVVGYVRLPLAHFGAEQPICETSRLGFDAALAVLNHVKSVAEQRGKPGLRLNVPPSCDLMKAARPFAASEYTTYAWQIHVPDIAALLRALRPVLEARLARSLLAGLTQDVSICLFRETIVLRFASGRLADVVNAGFTQRGEISFPPDAFIPLLFGWRSLEEQRRAYPDVGVSPAQRLLVDTLFPVVESFLYNTY